MDEREGVGRRVRAPSFVTTPWLRSSLPSVESVREAEHCIGAAPSAALSLPSLGQLVRGNVPLPIPGCVSKSVNMNQGRMEGKRKERQQNLREALTPTTLRSIFERDSMNKLKWIRRICHCFSSEQCLLSAFQLFNNFLSKKVQNCHGCSCFGKCMAQITQRRVDR